MDIGYETVLAGDDAQTGAIITETLEIWGSHSWRGHNILVPPDSSASVSKWTPLLLCEAAIVREVLRATDDKSPDVNEETEGKRRIAGTCVLPSAKGQLTSPKRDKAKE
jgi:hypothetical protein